MESRKEAAGFVLITGGLVAAWYSRPELASPWLWGGLAVAALGVFLVSRATRRGKPDAMGYDERDPLDGLDIPDSCPRPHHHDIGPDNFD